MKRATYTAYRSRGHWAMGLSSSCSLPMLVSTRRPERSSTSTMSLPHTSRLSSEHRISNPDKELMRLPARRSVRNAGSSGTVTLPANTFPDTSRSTSCGQENENGKNPILFEDTLRRCKQGGSTCTRTFMDVNLLLAKFRVIKEQNDCNPSHDVSVMKLLRSERCRIS